MNDKNLELKEIYKSAVDNHQKGNSEIAENLYKKVLKKMPNHINTQTNLGALYAQTGKKEEAKNVLQNVLQIEPNNVSANANLGVVFYQSVQYEKAEE